MFPMQPRSPSFFLLSVTNAPHSALSDGVSADGSAAISGGRPVRTNASSVSRAIRSSVFFYSAVRSFSSIGAAGVVAAAAAGFQSAATVNIALT